MSRLAVPLQAIVVSIVIHALWGGVPIAVKFSLLAFPPMWTAFLRFIIGIVCIAAWARWRGLRIWPTRDEWSALAFIAAMFAVQIGTMNLGYSKTSGAMGSILIATNPIFAAVFAHFLIAGDRLTLPKTFGLAVAMAGTVAVLLHDADLARLDFGAAGNWIVVGSAALLGFRLAFSARVLRDIDPVRVALWQMLLSLPVFGTGALLFESIVWENIGPAPILGLLFQGVIIAGVGFTLTFHLMQRYTPSVVMSFNFVSPISGVLLAGWLLGESVTAVVLIGMVLVAVGLYLIARRQ